MRISDHPILCPDCGRRRSECWILPCLGLEMVLARGARAVQAWVRLGYPKAMRAGVKVVAR